MRAEQAALEWLLEMGADEAIDAQPRDWRARPEPPGSQPPGAVDVSAAARSANPAPHSPRPIVPTPESGPGPANQIHRALDDELAGITSLAGLAARLDTYDGCSLKNTAMNTVFGAGAEDARVMIIGEAPGEEEDRRGIPFIGPSGKLLEHMLAAIGLTREQVYITNTIYWRPPGNRTPTPQEVQACAPFLRRQAALIQPEVLLLVGGAAAKTVLNRKEGIMRLRGKWFDADFGGGERPIAALATFHPAYLLRSPAQKGEAWRDLLAVEKRLAGPPQ